MRNSVLQYNQLEMLIITINAMIKSLSGSENILNITWMLLPGGYDLT